MKIYSSHFFNNSGIKVFDHEFKAKSDEEARLNLIQLCKSKKFKSGLICHLKELDILISRGTTHNNDLIWDRKVRESYIDFTK
jgi:hypothetical protein